MERRPTGSEPPTNQELHDYKDGTRRTRRASHEPGLAFPIAPLVLRAGPASTSTTHARPMDFRHSHATGTPLEPCCYVMLMVNGPATHRHTPWAGTPDFTSTRGRVEPGIQSGSRPIQPPAARNRVSSALAVTRFNFPRAGSQLAGPPGAFIQLGFQVSHGRTNSSTQRARRPASSAAWHLLQGRDYLSHSSETPAARTYSTPGESHQRRQDR